MGFWDGFKETVSRFGKVSGKSLQITGDIARLDFADAVKHTGDIFRYTELDKAVQIGTQAIAGNRSGQMPGREQSPEDLARQARLDALQQFRSGGARGAGAGRAGASGGRAVLSGGNGTSRSNQQLMVGR